MLSHETVRRSHNIDIALYIILNVSITKSNLAAMLCRVRVRGTRTAKREEMHRKKKRQHQYKSQFETLDAKMLRLKSPVGKYLWQTGHQATNGKAIMRRGVTSWLFWSLGRFRKMHVLLFVRESSLSSPLFQCRTIKNI